VFRVTFHSVPRVALRFPNLPFSCPSCCKGYPSSLSCLLPLSLSSSFCSSMRSLVPGATFLRLTGTDFHCLPMRSKCARRLPTPTPGYGRNRQLVRRPSSSVVSRRRLRPQIKDVPQKSPPKTRSNVRNAKAESREGRK
jgi:hypothetical protein